MNFTYDAATIVVELFELFCSVPSGCVRMPTMGRLFSAAAPQSSSDAIRNPVIPEARVPGNPVSQYVADFVVAAARLSQHRNFTVAELKLYW